MALLGQNGFDYTTVEDTSGILPQGDYAFQITESELKATKNGNGQMLVLRMEVIEGPQKGTHFENLNIINPSQAAVTIAQQTLKRLCEACQVPSPLLDSEDLHYKPFRASIVHKESGEYTNANLKKIRPYNTSASPSGSPVTSQPSAPSGQGGAAKMPWD